MSGLPGQDMYEKNSCMQITARLLANKCWAPELDG